MSELSLQTLSGAAIRPYLPEVARLRIAVFREWPYLYDGDLDYEARYLEVYARSGSAVLVLVRDGERVVGASTGIPLAEESEPFRKPFIKAGIPPETVFYCGESVLDPAYRGRGLYRQFFAHREAHARALGGSAGALLLPSSAIPMTRDVRRGIERSTPPGKRLDTAKHRACACSLAGRSSVRTASG